MKNSQIIPSLQALQEFSDATKTGPVRTSFAISRTIKTLRDRLEELNEAQKKLVTDLSKKDADGKPVHPTDADGNVDPNKMEQANPVLTSERIQELYDLELEDFKVTPFKLSDLEKMKLKGPDGKERVGVELSASALATLDWLIIDDSAAKPE